MIRRTDDQLERLMKILFMQKVTVGIDDDLEFLGGPYGELSIETETRLSVS
jgi:hypothetical protein